MGIDVLVGSRVVYNGLHDHLVVTCPSKNPTEAAVAEMRVQFVFRRVMSRDRKTGDGNPLIYALKRKKGYSISIQQVKYMVPSFRLILEKISTTSPPFDLVVPMPSAHNIGLIVSNRIVRFMKGGAVKGDLLRKKTYSEVLAEIKALPPLISKKKRDLVIALCKKLEKSTGDQSFSMKEVDSLLRPMIHPITFAYRPTVMAQRILLVDDLVSSGSTLSSARAALLTIFPGSHIESLCLLSQITKR